LQYELTCIANPTDVRVRTHDDIRVIPELHFQVDSDQTYVPASSRGSDQVQQVPDTVQHRGSGRPRATDGSSGEYTVAKILDTRILQMRGRNLVTQYRVRWAGYSQEYDTWEPESGLTNCKSLIEDYKRKHPHPPRIVIERPAKEQARTSKHV